MFGKTTVKLEEEFGGTKEKELEARDAICRQPRVALQDNGEKYDPEQQEPHSPDIKKEEVPLQIKEEKDTELLCVKEEQQPPSFNIKEEAQLSYIKKEDDFTELPVTDVPSKAEDSSNHHLKVKDNELLLSDSDRTMSNSSDLDNREKSFSCTYCDNGEKYDPEQQEPHSPDIKKEEVPLQIKVEDTELLCVKEEQQPHSFDIKEEAQFSYIKKEDNFTELSVTGVPSKAEDSPNHNLKVEDNELLLSDSDHTRSNSSDFDNREKSFSCTYCGKRFSRKSRLESHTRTHTEYKTNKASKNAD
ncbi:involucrin-like isoform X2 [Corythoichthys intestinalis]|uniref:involucrin-like isoform X2 n=1 Tax=Corythoichthys intestinalis TaxID=161448 RepID=UPI0025A61720|nr:involucrin-like isoform X2 [Corythoichthys intestinalis]